MLQSNLEIFKSEFQVSESFKTFGRFGCYLHSESNVSLYRGDLTLAGDIRLPPTRGGELHYSALSLPFMANDMGQVALS